MDWLVYVLFCAFIALISLIVIGFIQRVFRKHLILWSTACATYFISYLSVLYVTQNIHPFFPRFVHPVFLTLSGFLVLCGVLVYLDRPLRPGWLLVFGLAIAWALGISLAGAGMAPIVLGPRLVIGCAYLWISIIAASHAVASLYRGSRLISIVFILWGALNTLIPLPGMMPHGCLLDGLLGLAAAISFLLMAMNASHQLLIEEELKYRALFNTAKDAIFVTAVAADGRPDRYLEINAEAEKLLGYTRDELLAMDRSALEAIEPHRERPAAEEAAAGEEGSRRTFESEYTTKEGGRVPVEVSANAFRLNGRTVTMSIVRDITERRRAEERIRYLALYDGLTGLNNRAFCEQELARMGTAAHMPLSLIMADLNGLKLTNDLFGHEKGDMMLTAFGLVLRQASPQGAVAARWGGDEFVLLLPGTDERGVQQVAKRIAALCDEIPPAPIGLNVALGAATAAGLQDVTGLLRAAEDRMYRHKFLEHRSSRSFTTRFMQRALEEKSHETEGHCERLRRMSAMIGQATGMNNGEIDELSLAAVLHDIGKLTMPDQILAKPGKLTAREYGIIKGHCEIGYKIARASPELSSIARCILSHHERWDGRGYPQGLAGEAIPLYSRIIGLVDAYDAMVCRKGKSIREALAELRREAGAQFDPAIVEVFAGLMERGGKDLEFTSASPWSGIRPPG